MLYIFKYLFFIINLFVFTNANSLETDWSSGIESKVRLISSMSNNNNKEKIYLGLEYELQEGWKTYWQSPGNGGFPQEIDWSKSSNVKTLEIEWPVPEKFEILNMQSIGYSKHVIFPIKISLKDKSQTTHVNLDINYLVCKDICIPGNAHLELELLPGIGNLTKHSFILEKTISNLPQKNTELSFIQESEIKAFSNNNFVSIIFSAEAKNFFSNPSIFLHTKYGLPVTDPIIKLSTNIKNIDVQFLFNKNLIKDEFIDSKIIITDNNYSYTLSKNIIIEKKEIFKNNNYLFVILIAFIGGLILNGMPCVLPVLSIKILSLLKYVDNPISIRKSFLLTSLGIVSSFFLLAITFIFMRNFGYNIGWGIQFQQPFFLMFVGLVLILFALNMFGLFEFNMPNFINSKSINTLQNNYITRDFFNGFFATLMATPCSAPFVGSAITFAFTQSSFSLIYIFISMGIGMSFPYLILAFFPQTIKFLPKPGNWMVYLKYFLGILLLGTTMWICNILLNHFNHYFILSLLIILVFFIVLNNFLKLKKIYGIILIGIFFTLPSFSFFSSNLDNSNSDWLDFNEINIESIISQDSILFIDVTADWCATCQYNKINGMNSSLIKETFLKYKVVKIRADWTKSNTKIENFLQDNNKFGIPYNVIYDKNNLEGIELPELLSIDEIIKILDNL